MFELINMVKPNTFNGALQDTALKASILILGSCRSVHFDRPKTYQIVPKMASFDLIYEADYPDNTTFFIYLFFNSIKYEKIEEKNAIFTHS